MDPIWSMWVILGWFFLTHNGGLGWKNLLTQPNPTQLIQIPIQNY